ncbi:TetR family transcriptional regulator [Streptomyces sp. Ag109_O5-1]|nr:TetR family transcriptional regulator [Streptomyces sp. Ag109_O5-1]
MAPRFEGSWRRPAGRRPAPGCYAGAVSRAATEAPSSHTFSREILPSRNSKTCRIRKLIRRPAELLREGRTVTIADAAEAAQVPTATAYRYFSSPQELLRETRT